jgi:hypothetical protein
MIQLVGDENLLQEQSTNSAFQFMDVPAGKYTGSLVIGNICRQIREVIFGLK